MITVKSILSENRESIISSIKYIFSVYKMEEIKPIMVEFLDFAEKNMDVEKLAQSKKVKTDLKSLVARMSASKKMNQPRVKLAEMLSAMNDNNQFDLITKTWK